MDEILYLRMISFTYQMKLKQSISFGNMAQQKWGKPAVKVMMMMVDVYAHFCAHGRPNGPTDLQR